MEKFCYRHTMSRMMMGGGGGGGDKSFCGFT